jgi:hypothetical protein
VAVPAHVGALWSKSLSGGLAQTKEFG